MQNTLLSHSMVAFALLQLPDKRLDCQQFNVKMANFKTWNDKHRLLLPVASLSLTVIVDYDYDRTSAEYKLSVVLADNPATPVHFDQYADHIRFFLPDDPTHPLLSLLPTTTLYHSQNPPDNIPNPKIPCYQDQTCSLEQTHLLLQSHIPDLLPEVIATWSRPLKVSWECGWPTVPKNTEAQHLPRLHVHYSAEWLDAPFDLKESYNVSESPPPAFLYRLRNSILLHALLPQLAHVGWLGQMSATNPRSNRTLEHTDLSTLLAGNPCASFVKLALLTAPHSSLHIPARTQGFTLASLLENIGGIYLSSLFPDNHPDSLTPAKPAAPTPEEMLSKILTRFNTIQLLQLTV